MRKTIALLLCCSMRSLAQQHKEDTAHVLGDVVVSGFQKNDPGQTSLNILSYPLSEISDRAPYNLSDALAKLPGISQMTSGIAISKPVIRGLYGNRILMLYSGMRFDNQQWQDEHGLGLSQIGIDRAEVIKGPASLLYGSDALGGVINVVEERPSAPGSRLDAGTQLFTNTMGTLTDAGLSKRNRNAWWRLRLGMESHADYSDGKGTRVPDSRNRGYYFKAGAGFEKPKWAMENSYNFSYNQYGFIIDDLGSSFRPDDRWSRSMKGPHHNVMLNLFSSQNTFFLRSSLLKVNVGVQSNSRKEDEGGGQISLNMHLLSLLQSLRWEKELSRKVSLVVNQQSTYENNTNYGVRKIVPDASFIEGNASVYVRARFKSLTVEGGAGVSDKYIKTLLTKGLNSPGNEIRPFTKNDVTMNGMAGAVYRGGSATVKMNLATGFRSPNLAELSSNGLHEGVYRYEVGDPDLKTEQNLSTDIMLSVDRQQWSVSASVYHNLFMNYVYLAPTAESFYGFPVFRFRQQDARIYGAECVIALMPEAWKGISVTETFTTTKGELKDGGNLPFIPASRSAFAVRYERTLRGKISKVFLEPEYIYVFDQDMPSQFETSTHSYHLLNFSSGIEMNSWKLGLTCTNITNTAYADHLSRLKYFGLLNPGINFVFSARKEIKW